MKNLRFVINLLTFFVFAVFCLMAASLSEIFFWTNAMIVKSLFAEWHADNRKFERMLK